MASALESKKSDKERNLSMAIITTDIHGDPETARAFLKYQASELHVCLGDLVDSRKKKLSFEEENECLDLLLQSDSILLWGNHDLAYLPQEPWKCLGNFSELTFRRQYEGARDRILAAYAIDGWLCTHAGVSPKLAQLIPEEFLAVGSDAIAAWLNDEFAQELKIKNPEIIRGSARYGYGPLFRMPVCRGGGDESGGIFWFDPHGEQAQPSHQVGPQIFGHTPVLGDQPERGTSFDPAGGPPVSWINLNTFDGHWVYDTKADELQQLT